jgi:hypothetical protein
MINEALATNQCCSAAFLDISQTFGKSLAYWTAIQVKTGSSSKLLPNPKILPAYFFVKVENEYTELSPVKAEVPQGSVFGPFLYLLYTADLPTSPETTRVTFAYDSAVITTDNDPSTASHKLQNSLLTIQHWL